MRPSPRASVVLAVLAAVSWARASGKPEPQPAKKIALLHLCEQRAAAPGDRPFAPNLAFALFRVHRVYSDGAYGFRLVAEHDPELPSCQEAARDGCYGRAGEVFCDEEILSRLLHAVALVAAGLSVPQGAGAGRSDDGVDSPADSPADFPIDLVDALTVTAAQARNGSDGVHAFDALPARPGRLDEAGFVVAAQLVRDLRALDERRALGGEARAPGDEKSAATDGSHGDAGAREGSSAVEDPALERALSIYRAAADLLLGYLAARELRHAHGACAVDKPSAVERSGLLSALIGLQREGLAVCPEKLSPGEVDAERCALRVMESLDATPAPPPQQSARASAHRIVADTLSRLLRLEGPEADSSSELRIGDLHDALRLLLLAAELDPGDGKKAPLLCGAPATRFARGLERAAATCRRERILDGKERKWAELFAAYLPPAVAAAWRSDPPIPIAESFMCKASKAHPAKEKPPAPRPTATGKSPPPATSTPAATEKSPAPAAARPQPSLLHMRP